MEHSEKPNSSRFTQPVWLSLVLGMVFLGAGMVIGSIVMAFMLNLGGVNLLEPTALQSLVDSGELAAMHFLRWGQGISTLLTFAAAGLLWARFESLKPMQLLRIDRRPFNMKQLWLGMGVIVAAIPAVEFMQFDAETFSLPDSMKELEMAIEVLEESSFKTVVAMLSDTSFFGILSNIIVVALFAAIGEEIFFRGFLQQTLARFMNIHVAVWLTGFIFSAIHFQFLGFFSRFILGVMMGYLFVYSGSLWTSILAHFTNNALNVIVAALIIGGAFGEVELDQNIGFPVWATPISVVLTGGLFWLFLRFRQKDEAQENIPEVISSATEDKKF